MASGFVQLEDRWAGGLVGMWGPTTRAFSAMLMTEPHYRHGPWGAIGIQRWGVGASNLDFMVGGISEGDI